MVISPSLMFKDILLLPMKKIHQHDITIHKIASVASCKNNERNLLSQRAIFNAKNKYIFK